MSRDELDAELAALHDARLAERNRSMRDRGRRIGGAPGAVVAGMMIAFRDIYEHPPRDEGSVVVDAPTEPHDVDRDGVELTADDIGGLDDIVIPAQPSRPPLTKATAGHPRRRSRTTHR